MFVNSLSVERYFTGFCKAVLWSVFHSIPLTTDYHVNTHDSEAPETSEKNMWKAYRRMVKLFADAIAEVYREGDSVWIYGYELTLLPGMLRSGKHRQGS